MARNSGICYSHSKVSFEFLLSWTNRSTIGVLFFLREDVFTKFQFLLKAGGFLSKSVKFNPPFWSSWPSFLCTCSLPFPRIPLTSLSLWSSFLCRYRASIPRRKCSLLSAQPLNFHLFLLNFYPRPTMEDCSFFLLHLFETQRILVQCRRRRKTLVQWKLEFTGVSVKEPTHFV